MCQTHSYFFEKKGRTDADRRGKAEEIDKIMRIYEQARAFMRKNGNANTMGQGLPFQRIDSKKKLNKGVSTFVRRKKLLWQSLACVADQIQLMRKYGMDSG